MNSAEKAFPSTREYRRLPAGHRFQWELELHPPNRQQARSSGAAGLLEAEGSAQSYRPLL